jgi:hypothetical protein
MVYDNAHKIFLKYGAQGVAADFAYDPSRKFFKKGLDQHFGTFFFSGLGGIMQAGAMDNPWVRGSRSEFGAFAKGLGLRTAAYGIEYAGISYVKGNYQGFYTKGWQTKASVSGYKAIMNGLMLR